MKHYLFYIPFFAGGGAERVAVMLANQFSKNGNSVSFVVNRADGPHKALLAEDIPLYALNPGTHFSSIFLFSSLLKKIKPDYIFCRLGLCPIVGVLGRLLTPIRVKVIISYHNLFYPNTPIPLGAKIAHYSVSLLSRLSYCTVCVSSDIQTDLRDNFKASAKKLKVIYNPVDLEEANEKSKKNLPESLWEYQGKKQFILAVGRLTEQKDYPTLIRTFHRIHSEMPHDLVILGQGSLENNIRALVKELSMEDRVILPGFQQNPFPVFRAASLFVLSSIFEGFGNVIIEALAVGTPVVSTNCPGGPKEILANGKYGRLVPVGDDKALAEAVRLTLKNPLSAEILQERAGDFALDKIASQYESICEDFG